MTTQASAALTLLTHRGEVGVTWRELATVERMHHGSASRVLSDLHRRGDVFRLSEHREGCAVYVMGGHARGRTVVPYRQRPPADREDAAVMAARVTGTITRWGLDQSPSLHGLAADLRRAINRPLPTDQPTLGETP